MVWAAKNLPQADLKRVKGDRRSLSGDGNENWALDAGFSDTQADFRGAAEVAAGQTGRFLELVVELSGSFTANCCQLERELWHKTQAIADYDEL